MKFRLPLPISVNAMYRSAYSHSGKMGRYKTKEANDWQYEALQEIMVQKRGQKKPKGNAIYVTFYRKDNRRFDSSNYTKILYDTLVKAGILEDDSDLVFEQLQKQKADKNYCKIEVL